MKLETEPRISLGGPAFYPSLLDIFRKIAQVVNGNDDAATAAARAAAPPAMVGLFAANALPVGWMKANGAAVSRTVYPALFAALGTGYGPGDGSTTFNLPDLRGEFPRFWDDGRGLDTGRALGTAQGYSLSSHNHGLPMWTSGNEAGGYGLTATSAFQNRVYVSGTGTVTDFTGSTEVRPRNVALMACIKY